ncbi:MAG: PilC/PilY family type IV pilus protein, partial [Steroidobacteraceae bacterium]
QVQYSEDFTGAAPTNQWFFYNGACLTAGTSTSTTSPGDVPACTTVLQNYYNVANASTGKGSDPYLVGGDAGFLGGSTAPSSVSGQVADPVDNGALRFTNGYPYGYHENGAIVSDFTFPTTQGLEITFKTVTYLGDSGGSLVNGNGRDGADGMSFYLLDGCMPLSGGSVPSGCSTSTIYGTTNTFPGIGAWGGSLAYTCSNSNSPYDGLVGAYLGLGVDEYGNFLNGTTNTLGESGTSASGDNTHSGGGYQPGRIGLRGAGSVSWTALTTAYGAFNGSASPYYPASLTTSCVINGGTPDVNGLCSGKPTDAMLAVQKTCSTGNLYNYGGGGGSSSIPTTTSVKNPSSVGQAELSNAANTAGILDYDAMTSGTVGAYSVLPSSYKIANESARKRGSTTVANYSSADATPITYRVKVTPDGLLSFAYNYNGGAWRPVITGQNITSSNGPLPSAFRFGFAGSTGGSTNVHEVLCFKAAPAETSQSSGGINVYENPTIKFGTQLFLAYYFPSDWSGQLTAQTIGYDTSLNKVVVASTPSWDARCVLTGVNSTTGACSTGVTSLTAESSASRTMLTWSGSQGIPFEWSSLTAAEQAALDQGDPTQTSNRLNYLRGDRTNEMSSSGTCPQAPGMPCFRQRSSVLSDIVDSSPTWVGPPQSYDSTATWTDSLYPSATAPESAGESYTAFKTAEQSRLNVVYVGANDGFLHGFRAGSLDSNGNLVANSTTPNDGYEVLAYMPETVLQNIHNSTDATLDYANTQYAHDWFTDATPGSGDVFYADTANPNGEWHTWLVGGLGPGGAAIYALDVTDPSKFQESNASSLVIGEWTPSNLTCVNVANCGQDLGNTYGTPLIRRFHNGEWGVIFGNGYGSANGTAGIYIMLISPKDGSRTFYYLPTGSAATGNGIAN